MLLEVSTQTHRLTPCKVTTDSSARARRQAEEGQGETGWGERRARERVRGKGESECCREICRCTGFSLPPSLPPCPRRLSVRLLLQLLAYKLRLLYTTVGIFQKQTQATAFPCKSWFRSLSAHCAPRKSRTSSFKRCCRARSCQCESSKTDGLRFPRTSPSRETASDPRNIIGIP
eukprot:605489-Rhodomonas_salina.2